MEVMSKTHGIEIGDQTQYHAQVGSKNRSTGGISSGSGSGSNDKVSVEFGDTKCECSIF
jgi:hypothetical protein